MFKSTLILCMKKRAEHLAGRTRLELATFPVLPGRSNQLSNSVSIFEVLQAFFSICSIFPGLELLFMNKNPRAFSFSRWYAVGIMSVQAF